MLLPTAGHPTTGPAPLRVRLLAPVRGWSATLAIGLGALCMVVSGLVHLHLWDIAYRHVATLGPLFLLQGVLSPVLAVVVVLVRRVLVALAAAALMLGTIAGFLLALTTGLFGFKLGFVSGWAVLAVASESVAAALFGVAAVVGWSAAPSA